jgi:hypothetical protein
VIDNSENYQQVDKLTSILKTTTTNEAKRNDTNIRNEDEIT